MLRVVLVSMLALFASGCGSTATHPAATPPAAATPTAVVALLSSPTSTPSALPTPAPNKTWGIAPKTGVAYIDAIISAVVGSDTGTIESYLTGEFRPCGPYPECPPGISAGTNVRVVTLAASCDGRFEVLDSATRAAVAKRITSERLELVSAIRVRPGSRASDEGTRYWLAFEVQYTSPPASNDRLSGRLVIVDEAGITGFARSPSCNESAQSWVGNLQSSGDVLVPSPP